MKYALVILASMTVAACSGIDIDDLIAIENSKGCYENKEPTCSSTTDCTGKCDPASDKRCVCLRCQCVEAIWE